MVNFQLDEMQEMLRELAHEFAVDEIRPKAEHWDATSTYPKETIQAAHEMGLLNLHIPEAYGGPGLGSMEDVIVNEELAWGATLVLPPQPMQRHWLAPPSSPVLRMNRRTSGCEKSQKKVLLPRMQ